MASKRHRIADDITKYVLVIELERWLCVAGGRKSTATIVGNLMQIVL